MFEFYEPGEDSYTFFDVLKEEKLSKMLIVDVGCSTGFITELLAADNVVISTDINSIALEMLATKKNRNVMKMDLLSGFNQSSLDCVVFNPPYVPDFDCKILGGGQFGRDVIDKFVESVEVKLFYLLVIEANKPLEIVKNIESRGYSINVLKIRKVVGETIIILKARRQERRN